MNTKIKKMIDTAINHHKKGELNEAQILYQKVLKKEPSNFDAIQLLAIVYSQNKEYKEAINLYKFAIKINPSFPKTYYNIGKTFFELDQFEDALLNYNLAIKYNPNYFEAYNNRGLVLEKFKYYDEALASYDFAIKLKSNYSEAFNNRSLALKQLNRLEESLKSLNTAIQLNPNYIDAKMNKSLLKLLIGEYEEGWQLFESRRHKADIKKNYPSYSQPLWLSNESLEKKTILIHSEQGLGDSLQFCRYLLLLEKLNPKKIIFEIEKSLISIMQQLNNKLVIIEKSMPLPPFDYYCPLMSLPLAFKTKLETIPANIPYLKVDNVKNKHWQEQLGKKTKPRIGLVWSGSTKHTNDHNRSLKLQQASSLLKLPFEFHSLQKDIRDGDKQTLKAYKNIDQHHKDIDDFSDTAALVNQMDLIISVDTSVAHLAGALGKEVWILLPFIPDYRWLLDRDDSPWYPTAKLFRQSQIGDWNSVIQQLISELSKLFSK